MGENDGIGNIIGKCLGHDDVGSTGFVMKEFSHRRDQTVNKGFGGINMVEVQENMAGPNPIFVAGFWGMCWYVEDEWCILVSEGLHKE